MKEWTETIAVVGIVLVGLLAVWNSTRPSTVCPCGMGQTVPAKPKPGGIILDKMYTNGP